MLFFLFEFNRLLQHFLFVNDIGNVHKMWIVYNGLRSFDNRSLLLEGNLIQFCIGYYCLAFQRTDDFRWYIQIITRIAFVILTFSFLYRLDLFFNNFQYWFFIIFYLTLVLRYWWRYVYLRFSFRWFFLFTSLLYIIFFIYFCLVSDPFSINSCLLNNIKA